MIARTDRLRNAGGGSRRLGPAAAVCRMEYDAALT